MTTEELIAIHRRYVDAEYRRDVEARRAEHGPDGDGVPLPRTDAQRRFDALVAIFRAANSATEPGLPAKAVVNVLIDAHTFGQMLEAAGLASGATPDGRRVDPFTGLADPDALLRDLLPAELLTGDQATERRCETRSGAQLHPHDVLRACLSGVIRRAVVDTDGTIVDRGRERRVFTGAAREAARLLVRHCEHPGCELPAEFCQVDHDLEWWNDGRTDQANSRVKCGPHNRHKHRERWRTTRGINRHGYTMRADGTIVLPVGADPPDLPLD